MTIDTCDWYTWKGKTYYVSGDYMDTLTDDHGCTRVDTLHLTVNHTTYGDTTVIACKSFNWYEHTGITQSCENLTHTFTNSVGCDSVVTLHLTINPTYEHTDTITICANKLPFTWNEVEFTHEGTQNVTLPTVNGCDSVVVMTLIVLDTPQVVISPMEIGKTSFCDGDNTTLNATGGAVSYVWSSVLWSDDSIQSSITVTQGGTYFVTGTDAQGCSSTASIDITVNPLPVFNIIGQPSVSNGLLYICPDETALLIAQGYGNYSYYWNVPGSGSNSTIEVSEPKKYTVRVVNTNTLCFKTASVEVKTWQLPNIIINGSLNGEANICQGESIILTADNGVRYSWVGGSESSSITVSENVLGTYIYKVTGYDEHECSNTANFTVNVNSVYNENVSLTICETALPYIWRDTIFADGTVSGDYVFNRQSAKGCDSVVTLHLTISNYYVDTLTEAICVGDSYDFFGQTLTDGGTYSHTLPASNRCDSVIVLKLEVNPITYGDTTAFACNSFTWYGTTYNETPDVAPTHTFTNASGCDSVVTLHLIVGHSNTGDTTAFACNSFTWYGTTYNETPDVAPTHTFTNASGCDSVVTLHLTIGHSNTGDTTAFACNSFNWYGETFYETPAVAPTHTFTNASGCDSVVTLHLTVGHSNTGDTTAFACNSFTWYGQTFTETPAVAPTHTFTNTSGCDSVVTLYLTIGYSNTGDTTAFACNSFIWYGQTFDETPAVAPTHTFTNASGCDSVVTLHLTIGHSNTGDTTAFACNSFTWYGETFHETPAVAPTHAFTNASGCDSVVTLHLTIGHSNTGDTTAFACNSFTWYGTTYNETPDVAPTHTFTNASGCDSVVTLHLTIGHSNTGDTTVFACNSFTWYGQTFNETPAVAPTQTFTNASGCDSVVTLHLTIGHSNTGDTTAFACNSFTWYGQTFNETPAVAPTHTFTNASGCDSVVTLHLTIGHSNTGDTTAFACNSFTWYGQTFNETPAVAPTHTFINASGCDSVVTLHLTIGHSNTGDTTAFACNSFTWYGQTYTETPTVAPTHTFTNASGCDSVVTLHLTIGHSNTGDTTAFACNSFTWYGTTYYKTPVVAPTHTFINASGCDSVVTLHLTIGRSNTGDTTAFACNSFTWYGTTYTKTPVVAPTHTFINASGCDSVVTLHLTIGHSNTGDTTAFACNSFNWYGTNYTETPAVAPTHTFTNASGCDSVVTLHLTIGHSNTGDTTAFACNSFTWYGETFNETPAVAPTHTFTNASGCDSVVTLHLTVNPIVSMNRINNQVVCNSKTTTKVNFGTNNTGPGTVSYTWTNTNPSIGLPASGTTDYIPSFMAMNNTTAPIVGSIKVTPKYSYGTAECEGIPITFTITVNPTIAANSISNQVLCNNNSTEAVAFGTNATGTGNVTYAWTNTNTAINLAASGNGTGIASFTATNNTTNPIEGAISVTPTYTYSDKACSGTPANFTITVNPTIAANSISNQVLCNNNSTEAVAFGTNATGTGNVTYAWTNTNTAINLAASGNGTGIASFTATNNTTNPIEGAISVTPIYTYSNKACPGTPANFTITVNPTIAANSISNQVVCSNSSTETVTFGTNATGQGNVTYAWTNTNTAINLAASGNGTGIASFTATNNTTNPIEGAISVTPIYTYSNKACPGTPANFTITVNPTIAANSISNQVVCSNSSTETVTFGTNATGQGNVTYAWTNTNTAINLAASGNGTGIASFTATNVTTVPLVATITVTPTYIYENEGCAGDSTNFTITVNPIVSMNRINNQVLCNGDSTETVVFSTDATGSGTVSYIWTNSNPAIGLSDTAGTGNLPAFQAINNGTAPDSTTITVTPTYTYSGVDCEGTSTSFTITVNPTVQMDSISGQMVCNGGSTEEVVFSTNATGEGTVIYSWTVDGAVIGLSNGTGDTLPSFIAVNDNTEPVVATVTVTPTYIYANDSCVGMPTSFAITVNPTVRMDSITNQVVCNGAMTDAVVFGSNASGEGTVIYEWTVDHPEVGLSDGSGNTLLPFRAMNSTTAPLVASITVTPTYIVDQVNCAGTSTDFTVTVNPTAQVDSINNQVVCNGDSTETVMFSTNAEGADTVTYSWINSNPAIGLLAAAGTGNLPAFQAINDGTAPDSTTITVTPTYTYHGVACEGTSTSFTITVNPTAQVNAIENRVVCNGALTTPLVFTTNNSGGAMTYIWTNDTPGIGIDTVGEGNIEGFGAVNVGTEPIVAHITVTPYFSNGGKTCDGPVKEFTITINPTIAANSIPNQVWCDGALTDEVLFGTNATGEGAVTYAWTNNNSGIGLAETGESGATGIASFTATNGTSDPVSGTITVTPTYTFANVACEGTPAVFTITVNPNPSIHAIIGDSVFCQNQYAAYAYPVEDTQHYLYSWYLQGFPIGVNVDQYTCYISPDSLSYDTNVVISMEVRDLATGCVSDTSMRLRICSHNSPDTTFVIRKNNTNVLICREVSSPDGVVHYQWGYTDKATGNEMMYPTWDHNYYQFGHELNTTIYDYWVETYIIYEDVICRNRTYYVVDEPVGVESYNDDFNVLVYQQNGTCRLRITNSGMRHITGGLYDISGKLLQKMDYGKMPVVDKQLDLDYAHGVYVLVLYADGKRYTTKIAW